MVINFMYFCILILAIPTGGAEAILVCRLVHLCYNDCLRIAPQCRNM